MVEPPWLDAVENLGKKYEVREVKNGYARNFLLPNKLARAATKEALKWLKDQQAVIEQEAADDLKKAQEIASKVDGLEIPVMVKVGEKQELFESIDSAKISKALKDMGYEVKKSQVLLAKPIKETGEFPVKLNLDHNLEAEIKVIVSAQESATVAEEE